MSKSLYSKLFEVQKEIGTVTKDSTNPFFNSKYFDINKLLAVVKPVLNKHGLVILQPLTNTDEGVPALTTTIVEASTGDSISNSVTLPGYKTAQEMGSAVTYTRRYAIQSLLGLEAADDDGNLATYPQGNTPAPRKSYKRR